MTWGQIVLVVWFMFSIFAAVHNGARNPKATSIEAMTGVLLGMALIAVTIWGVR